LIYCAHKGAYEIHKADLIRPTLIATDIFVLIILYYEWNINYRMHEFFKIYNIYNMEI